MFLIDSQSSLGGTWELAVRAEVLAGTLWPATS
jgi:hypothetical protein